jgi:hypothetical protein
MKLCASHDGSGNFCIEPQPLDWGEENSPALRMLLSSILSGIGQALLFEAGKAIIPLPDLRLTVAGKAEGNTFTQEGLHIIIEVAGAQDTLEHLASAALAACFPKGALACPLHHIVIARSYAVSGISEHIALVNLGLEGFCNELKEQNVPTAQVDWRPPAGGDKELIDILCRLHNPEVDEANAETIRRMKESRPLWTDVQPAIKAIPGMQTNHILHSGPPIDFYAMCDPQQRAVEAAAIFEGWVADRDGLEAKLKSGDIVLANNYSFGSIGAMCGVISPSMPVLVTENAAFGTKSWSTFNEGKGNVIWMGTYDKGTIERLCWMRDVFGPVMGRAIRAREEGLDIFKLIAQGVLMGDEVHARSAACTLLLLREMLPLFLKSDESKETINKVTEFIAGNNHSFLSFTLTACKAAAEAAHGVKHSTIVTAMSRNGVDFGLRIGGLDEWFIAPTAPMDEAIYYSGYGPQDAAGDIGDSAIVETLGLGGMVIGGAPSISSFVGGGMANSRRAMHEMQRICASNNPKFAPGAVDFTPAPLGIDLRKVMRLGVTPIVDTGVLHKASGVGQIGTGIARAPIDVFAKALRGFGTAR